MHGILDTSSIDSSFIWPTLKNAGYEKSEDSLLKAIEENPSKKVVYYAVIGLWQYGTMKSIPLLKELTNYPHRDIQTTSVVTIGKITGGNESKFFGELLDDPRYKDKMYPMTVLWEVGTGDALPAVKRFAQKIIDGKIKFLADTIDPRYLIDYLKKHEDQDTEMIINRLNSLL